MGTKMGGVLEEKINSYHPNMVRKVRGEVERGN